MQFSLMEVVIIQLEYGDDKWLSLWEMLKNDWVGKMIKKIIVLENQYVLRKTTIVIALWERLWRIS